VETHGVAISLISQGFAGPAAKSRGGAEPVCTAVRPKDGTAGTWGSPALAAEGIMTKFLIIGVDVAIIAFLVGTLLTSGHI